jgi:hypothetical protein
MKTLPTQRKRKHQHTDSWRRCCHCGLSGILEAPVNPCSVICVSQHSVDINRCVLHSCEGKYFVNVVNQCSCVGRNGVTFDIFSPKPRGSVEFLWLELYTELVDSNQDDVPRQWHLRSPRGDGHSPYCNEERGPMVFSFSSGSNHNLHFCIAVSVKHAFMFANNMECHVLSRA